MDVIDDKPDHGSIKTTLVSSLLLAFNLAVWGWATITFYRSSTLLGATLIAYSLGLRHAFDADHVAAIDNVTRKLAGMGLRPISSGLFFALGHSTIVLGLTLFVASGATALQNRFEGLRHLGGLIGGAISATFLFTIAAANLGALRDMYRRMRFGASDPELRGNEYHHLQAGLLISKIFKPAFGLVRRSWQMYPIGLLFGLGFDTATEISLLGMSTGQALSGLPIASILIFPALFTAGMTLLDNANGVLTLKVYESRIKSPRRQAHYNFFVTLATILAAVMVGTVEGLDALGSYQHLHGAFWTGLGVVSANFGLIGVGLAAVLIGSGLLPLAFKRRRWAA